MSFIHEDFLLGTKAARRLYHEFAAPEPILDYHNHLSPADLAQNRRFKNLWEIWLEGDHYKWRAMRTNGVPERFCTGEAQPREKFLAWAGTVPHTVRNPLYHWTHLELKRYFGINELLNQESAARIWDQANEQLADPARGVHGILRQFDVRTLCTTDDPADGLESHRVLARSDLATRVYPCFRLDRGLAIPAPAVFGPWLARLELACDRELRSYAAFRDALRERHDFFHSMGCRLSDHGLDHLPGGLPSGEDLERIFNRAVCGQAVSLAEQQQFAFATLLEVGRWNHDRGWTLQLHVGALRNNNSRLLAQLGPDTGFDSIGDYPQAALVADFLNTLERENRLPKTILYNANPADNYLFATMLGNFQDGSIPGKVQLGSGWWFLDQKDAMEWQLNALSNAGLIARFIGMVTDSRSFMSFPRHEYFRRVLCNLLGRDVAEGLLPDDDGLLGPLVRNICFQNAQTYLGLPEPVRKPTPEPPPGRGLQSVLKATAPAVAGRSLRPAIQRRGSSLVDPSIPVPPAAKPALEK